MSYEDPNEWDENREEEEWTKYCHSCKQEKRLDQFYKCTSRRFGRQTQCKECQYNNNQHWYNKNKIHKVN